ncbi:50S ribosomal protein L23 [Candidatus Dependentiae bacterium]|nr:50S ribosomal protein L23 [Candidatus Dependentiae bacterium]
MELNSYGVIRKLVMTPKTWKNFQKLRKLTFEVERCVNKVEVKQAIEKIWDVKVDKVNIINMPDSSGVFARRRYVKPGVKRAIVTLREGHSINLPGEAMQSAAAFDSQDVVEREG